jgi:hypothetical protein
VTDVIKNQFIIGYRPLRCETVNGETEEGGGVAGNGPRLEDIRLSEDDVSEIVANINVKKAVGIDGVI